MFEPDYLLFCAGTSKDENGNLSLHGIFEGIYAPSFPTQQRPFVLIFKLIAKKAVINQHIKMKIVFELNDAEVNKVDIDGDFTVEKGNNLTLDFDVSQFVFPEVGNYDVKLYVADKLMITRTLKLRDAAELVEK